MRQTIRRRQSLIPQSRKSAREPKGFRADKTTYQFTQAIDTTTEMWYFYLFVENPVWRNLKMIHRLAALPQLVAFLGFLGLSGIFLLRENSKITFLVRVELPLKQAAYAESTDECQRHLSVAISYLKGLGLAKTAQPILPADPKSPSVQAWFNGLVEIQEALVRSHLEQHRSANDTLLLLIRDRLMLENAAQLTVLLPAGVQTYPYTEFYFWWGWISLATTAFGILWWWRKNT